MRCWSNSRLNKRINAVKDKLGALEAHHGGLRKLSRHKAMRRDGISVLRERKRNDGELPVHVEIILFDFQCTTIAKGMDDCKEEGRGKDALATL